MLRANDHGSVTHPRRRDATRKLPYDFPEMFRRLRRATKSYTPAAMFQLKEEGYDSLFEILVACIISIRTFEEVTLPVSRNLFAHARKPSEMAKLSAHEIDELIHKCTFHGPKSRTIHSIAQRVANEFGDALPCDFDLLKSFPGVGPKCANLALGVTCDEPHGVAVDIHVHRVTNRWGLVKANDPEKARVQLEEELPKRYWIEINKLLVPFGKFICTARKPKCSTCPLLPYCRQVGVKDPE